MLTDQVLKKGWQFFYPRLEYQANAEWKKMNQIFLFSRVYEIVKAEDALEFLFCLSSLTVTLKTGNIP